MLLEVHLHTIVYLQVSETMNPERLQRMTAEVCQSLQAVIMDAVAAGKADPDDYGEVVSALARPDTPLPICAN